MRHLLSVMFLLHAGSVVDAATWLETRQSVESLAASGDYSAALALEPELLSTVAQEFGNTSLEYAESLQVAGTVRSQSGQYFDAEAKLLDALDLVEQAEGPLSTRLIDPFLALGDNYHRMGEHDLALGAFNEARSLSRRAEGLFNPAQIPILERMADAMLGLDRYPEARDLRGEALTLLVRDNPPASLEVIDERYRFADWLERHADVRSADLQYGVIGGMIRFQFDSDPDLLVPLLRRDAENRKRVRMASGEPPGFPHELVEALALVEARSDPDPLLRAEVLLDLADWYVAFEQTWNIASAYAEVWDALGDVANGDELRQQWFSGLTLAYAPPLNSRHLVYDSEAPEGRVVGAFSIDEDGRPRDFELVESDPEGLIDRAFQRQIMNSRFRPRVVDGRVVASTGTVSTEFRYEPR